MYRLNDTQQRLVADAAAVADTQIAPHASTVDQTGAFPRPSLSALGERGYWGLMLPAEYGGLGEGHRTAAAVLDAVAQRCASTAMVYLMHLCGVACYAAAEHAPAQLLKSAPRGKHLSA